MSRSPTTSGVVRLCLRLLPYARRRSAGLTAIGATTLLGAALAVLKPWPMKFIVDNVLLGQPTPEWAGPTLRLLPGSGSPHGLLIWGVVATVVLFAAGWVLRLAGALANVAFGQRMVYDLAGDLFDHLQRLSLRFHNRKSVGDSIRRVTADCGCIATILREALLPVVSSLVTLAVMVTIMWKLDPLLTVLAVAVVPALAVVLRLYARPMMDRSYHQQEVEGGIYDDIDRTFSAIPLVQTFCREEHHERQFRGRADAAIAAAMSTTNLQLQFKILCGLITALGTAAIIWFGAQRVVQDQLTVGTILVFLSYLAALYGPIEVIMYSSFTVQGATGSARRVVEVLETRREVDDKPDAAALAASAASAAPGHLRIENVTFGYDEGRPVLREVSLEALPGETIAIVGATGAGKSTLVSLVPRFVDPWRGRVMLDGRDVRDLRLIDLRGQVSVVLQEPFLFPMTVAENISYGRPQAPREQIVEAARAANAHNFIVRLERGYDTPVGERGANLSGGERQRLAIARALLRDAPLLVLDEPTSSLDTATERLVLDALRRLMRTRTTLVIAHRLSTIRDADRIIVLDEGRLVESGTHDDLIGRGGVYARLYSTQIGDGASPGADS